MEINLKYMKMDKFLDAVEIFPSLDLWSYLPICRLF